MIKNVLEWLEKTAKERPEKPAYLEKEKSLSFAATEHLAKSIGSALLSVKNAAPVAVISGRRIETIPAYLGIVYSGHAYAPIDGTLPGRRIETIISTLKPSAILADEQYVDLAEELSGGEVPVFLLEEVSQTAIDQDGLDRIRRAMVMTDPLSSAGWF